MLGGFDRFVLLLLVVSRLLSMKVSRALNIDKQQHGNPSNKEDVTRKQVRVLCLSMTT